MTLPQTYALIQEYIFLKKKYIYFEYLLKSDRDVAFSVPVAKEVVGVKLPVNDLENNSIIGS